MSLFPTLARTWMIRGQQKKVPAPGVHPPKCYEFAAADWRTGSVLHGRSESRNAAAFCRLVERCVARSAKRKRRVILVTDSLKIHTAKGSRKVAAMLQEHGRHLTLRYIPKYAPECMPMEHFWEDWRDHVTNDHERSQLAQLRGDSDRHFARSRRNPRRVLQTLGSPFAHRRQTRRT